jgi:hypothetical protein
MQVRVARDRDADEVFISDVTSRWIEVDPARGFAPSTMR